MQKKIFTFLLIFINAIICLSQQTINNTGVVTISNSSSVFVNGNYLNQSGAQTIVISSASVTVSGDLTNNGTFTQTTSNIFLNGDTTQTIGGTTATTFYNLSTSGTGTKTLANNLTVQNNLALGSSEINAASYKFILSNTTTSSLSRTSGYINNASGGMFVRSTASTSPYVFPMGYMSTDTVNYYTTTISPGKATAQTFSVGISNTHDLNIAYDKTLHGTSAPSTLTVTIQGTTYAPMSMQIDIDNNADISAVKVYTPSTTSWINLPASKFSITGGNSLLIFDIPMLLPSFPNVDGNFFMAGYNTTYVTEYGEGDIIVSEQMQYYDLLGRPTQSQTRNFETGEVIVSESVYDTYGRAALQTLPAPAGTVMQYKHDFILDNAGQEYTYNNFDVTAKLNSPDAVSATWSQLGKYYSDNGSENFVATTSYPYVRTEFTADPGGDVKRAAKAGNEFKMGSGHETRSFTMISGDELKKIFGTDSSYKVSLLTDRLNNKAVKTTGGITAVKTISIDADGKEIIAYSYNGLPIASCYSGITTTCVTNTITSTMKYTGTQSVDIHLPAAKKTTLKLVLPTYLLGGFLLVTADPADISYKITDINTNTVLSAVTDYTVNASTRYVTFIGSYASDNSGKSLYLRVSFEYDPGFYPLTDPAVEIPDVYVTYDLDYSQWGLNYYDLAGRLRKTVSPKGVDCASPGTHSMKTTYDYSNLGQLIAEKSPDEGKKEYVYDAEGKLRFSQNAVQLAANKFSYTNYDKDARPTESGEHTAGASGSTYFTNYYAVATYTCTPCTSTAAVINTTDGLADANCADQSYIYYYNLGSTAEQIPSGWAHAGNYEQKYLLGQVSKTKNANNATWYSYDYAGKNTFTVQRILDADYVNTNSVVATQMKTIDYTYNDYTGLPLTQVYQANESAEYLKHRYTYDANLALENVYTQRDSEGEILQCRYSYYKTGALKRKEIATNLQGIDYIYTVNGELKSINHPSLDENKDPGSDGVSNGFAKDVFAMALDYHDDDYTRTGSHVQSSSGAGFYNGMIEAFRWKTRSVTNGVPNGADHAAWSTTNEATLINGTSQELMYKYTYNDQYRLNTATFGIYNNTTTPGTFTADANNAYREYGPFGVDSYQQIIYDANGNITALNRNGYYRNGAASAEMDDFSYTYSSNTNKLSSIEDVVSTAYYGNDFNTGGSAKTFTVNAIGQMTASQAENVDNVEYNVRGLVSKVEYNSGHEVEYFYNERGIKQKVVHDNGSGTIATTWYITDAGGTIQGIYTQENTNEAIDLTGQPIYAAGRIGNLDVTTDDITYELTDHLGNVRATFQSIGSGTVQVTSWQDYYAFGSVMPGRRYVDEDYAYGYQGQEDCAGPSNWKNFELRQLNTDLGRWMAPDPYGQFHSPYVAMGNVPNMGVDPDGGFMNLSFVYNRKTNRYDAGYSQPNSSDWRSLEDWNIFYSLAPQGYMWQYTWGDDKYGNRVQTGKFLRAVSNADDPGNWGREDYYSIDDWIVLPSMSTFEHAAMERLHTLGSTGGYDDVESFANDVESAMGTGMLWGNYKAAGDGKGGIVEGTTELTGIFFRESGSFNREYLWRQGDGMPTMNEGGFITNQKDFYSFMRNQAANNPVEVAAFGLNDGIYFVQPWAGNSATRSSNNRGLVEKAKVGYTIKNIVSQFHTHPNSSKPSYQDAKISQIWNIPVHSIGADGLIWQTFYPWPYIVPPNPFSRIID